MPARVELFGLTLLVTALLGACGGSSRDGPPANAGGSPGETSTGDHGDRGGTGEVCALVTKEEAEELGGQPMRVTELPGECTYTRTGSGTFASVHVLVGEKAQRQMETDKELGSGSEPMSGIGDEAVGHQATIYFKKNGKWYGLGVARQGDQEIYGAILKKLAVKVADRVGG